MWSRYTYFFKTKKKFFLYNSLSNSLAELKQEDYELLNKMKEEDLSLTDKELEKQLRKLKVIVDNDKDEINKVKYLNLLNRNENRRLILTINPTLACNFNCPYCFENEHSNIYMHDLVEEKIILFIKKHIGLKALDVTWFGGEPLLAFDRIVSMTKKMQNLGLNYKAGMITNGYLLTEKVISKLESLAISSIQITLDGMADLHNTRRCLKSGKPTFDKILHNIDLLQKVNPQIRINVRVNVDKTNYADFLELYKFLKDKQYPTLNVSLAFVKDVTGCKKCKHSYNMQEQAQIVMELLQKYGLDFSMVFPQSDRYECAIRNKNALVIGPEGEIYKCWNDVGNKSKVIGNIDGEITNEALLLRYLVAADPFEDPMCQNCFLLPVCGGGCPYSRIQNEYEGTNINTCLYLKDHLEDFLIAHAEFKNRLNSNLH